MPARQFLDVVYGIAAEGATSLQELDEALEGPRLREHSAAQEDTERKLAKIRALGGDVR